MIYLTLTRPDITYVINMVSQFMHAPINIHFASVVVERIRYYLKKNPRRWLLYTRGGLSGETYTDVDWARSVDDRRSNYIYYIYLEDNLVIWRSKSQMVCIIEGQILVRDIGLQVDGIMRLYYDNKAAINLFNNPNLHDYTKYVEIDRHFIRKKINSKELTLIYQDPILNC